MRKLKKPITYFLLGVILTVFVVLGLNSCKNINSVDVVITPTPTVEPVVITATPIPTATPLVITATPIPTATPVLITATPIPTATPVVITETPMPTATPVVITATPIPTATPVVITATPVPTATYVPVPTATLVLSTPKPTAQVTVSPTPTLAPTPTPTLVPTKEPTPVPTATPTSDPGPANLENINKQLGNISVSNEILPLAGGNKTRDFYNIIDLNRVNQDNLYISLKKLFVNCIAHSIDIKFSYEGSAESRLLTSLNSAVCPTCGRLIMTYKTENTSEMSNLMKQITDIKYANQIMLDFLQEHTTSNPSNMNERLTIICAGH